MSSDSFPPLWIEPSLSTHTHTIILIHGRNSSGPEFAEDLFSSLTSSNHTLRSHLPNWRWVFPSAKPGWSTVFQEELSEWFDIYSLSNPSTEWERQLKGLNEGLVYVERLVEEETKLVGGSENVVLGGISQGMAMALYALLEGRVRVGGFVGSSGWLPFAEKFIAAQGFRSEVPVFLGHGKDDGVVVFRLGEEARDVLRRLGMRVEWKEYDGADNEGHWLKEPEELDDIVAFLEKIAGRHEQETSAHS